MSLNGAHAIVTGGGTGIGAVIATALEAEGAVVTRIGRRPETLGPDGIAADVTDPAQVAAAFAAARAARGPISILVANAGAAESAPFDKTDFEAWRRMFAVNADSVFHCCKAALEDLVAAPRGRIVTIASSAGLRGYPYTAAYGAAKHAAVGLMRMIAQDYANASLRANAVCPGFTDTALVDESAARTAEMTGMTKDQVKASMGGFNPRGRLIQPAEIAAVVVELINSERTGEAVPVE
ncbi:MAG TPA: SDR family oxidoreductase [Allosphingosinicella sp.]|nr:SDR family oxidoreductase [Allosphingosinicella sp.]